MGKLKNIKHESFAQEYVFNGSNGKQSYLKAGYKVNDATAEVNASKLLRNTKVSERIEELREKQSKKFEYEADYTSKVLKKLLEDAVIEKVNDDSGETTFKDNRMALEVLKELNKMGGNYKDNKLKIDLDAKVEAKTVINVIPVK